MPYTSAAFHSSCSFDAFSGRSHLICGNSTPGSCHCHSRTHPPTRDTPYIHFPHLILGLDTGGGVSASLGLHILDYSLICCMTRTIHQYHHARYYSHDTICPRGRGTRGRRRLFVLIEEKQKDEVVNILWRLWKIQPPGETKGVLGYSRRKPVPEGR